METDTMSCCFNNRDGNVEIKCWWSRLSDLCYLIDKASLSELQSVKGDRITKMVVGWKQTQRRPGDGHGDWGGQRQLHADVVRDATQVRKKVMRRRVSAFTLGKCISPECSLCLSA